MIAGLGNFSTGITIGSGTSIGGGNGSVEIHHGTVTADEYWAVDFFPMRGGDRAELFNSRIVTGERGSFRGNQTGKEVTNIGTMIGQVDMDQGDDVLTNSGLIDGDVFLGIGADTYEGPGDGEVTGTVYGMNPRFRTRRRLHRPNGDRRWRTGFPWLRQFLHRLRSGLSRGRDGSGTDRGPGRRRRRWRARHGDPSAIRAVHDRRRFLVLSPSRRRRVLRPSPAPACSLFPT